MQQQVRAQSEVILRGLYYPQMYRSSKPNKMENTTSLLPDQLTITEEIAQESVMTSNYGSTIGLLRKEKSQQLLQSRSAEQQDALKQKSSKFKKYKKQVPSKLKGSANQSKKISGRLSPVEPSSLLGYSSAKQQPSLLYKAKSKQSTTQSRPYSTLQTQVSKESILGRTQTELGIGRVDKARGMYDPQGLSKVKKSLGQRKKSQNEIKIMTTSQLKQPTTFKNSPQILYEEFQAAKNELKLQRSGTISQFQLRGSPTAVATASHNNSQNYLMRKTSTMMADLSKQTQPLSKDRSGRNINKMPSTVSQLTIGKLSEQPSQKELVSSSFGAAQVSKTAKKKKTGVSNRQQPTYSQIETLGSAAADMLKQLADANAQQDSVEQAASRLASEKSSSYQTQKMHYTNAHQNLQKGANEQRAGKASFDLHQFQRNNQLKEAINQNQPGRGGNGKGTPLVAHQPSLGSAGSSSVVPRQINDTGRAPSKGAQPFTPGKPHQHSTPNPYQSKQVESKALRQPPTSSTPSLKAKYLNLPQEKMQQQSAHKPSVQYSNQSLKQQNIFGAEPRSQNPDSSRLHRESGADGGPRMPFDLANTFISSDSTKAQVPATRTQTQTIAQKMHHMVTADNDLSRKSFLGSGLDTSVLTGRSNDMHHKPDSGIGEANFMKTHQRISAKIPAKIKANDSSSSSKLKDSQGHQKQLWMATETIQIDSKRPGDQQSRRDFESSEVSHASRVKGHQPIHSIPKRSTGTLKDRSDHSLKETKGSNINHLPGKNSRHDVDNIGISVKMEASKGKLQAKRNSAQIAGPHLLQRSDMPLATKYPVSGAWGLTQKEPNKFPSSNIRDNQIIYNETKPGMTRTTINNRFDNINYDQSDSAQKVDMSIEKDFKVNHPLLSKSQSGMKKRPSMSNVSHFAAYQGKEEGNDSFVMLDNEQNQYENMRRNGERSDSYFGRFQNMLGFNKSLASEPNEQVRLTEYRREIMSEQLLMSPQFKPQNVVPKLTLKESSSVDDLQPVSSQKFESPMAVKQLSSHRFKCACEPSSEPYSCASAYQWLIMANNGREFEIQKSRKAYLDLLGIKDFISMAEERQIECDITRTFPHQQIFQEAQGEGQQALQRVLQAFSKYDASIGYVQGMNFIVGALLLHCSEEVTFWLFVALIEDYEMRDIYMEGLPGHIKHSTLITQLMETHLGELYEHLQDIGMNIEIFATDWYFTLFAKVIPTHQMKAFFDNFFQYGWCFFHKFTLTLLRVLAPQILQMEDMQEIKTLLLLPKHKQSFYGNGSPLVGRGGVTQVVEESKSETTQGPFSGMSDTLSQQAASSTQAEQAQRTFLSSIGNFFWPSRESASSSIVDAQLQELMGNGTIEELLAKDDAWIEIIHISRNLWGKRLTDGMIKQFLNDYEQLEEEQKIAQLQSEAKFHDSHSENEPEQEDGGNSDVLIGRSSNLTVKKQQSSNLAHKKKPSDSPLPQRASFSSNELEDDNFENPSNEISPMKRVNDSGMRMPKQTKLMFKNMDNMRQVPQKTPRVDSNRNNSEVPIAVVDFYDQFSQSQGISSQNMMNSKQRRDNIGAPEDVISNPYPSFPVNNRNLQGKSKMIQPFSEKHVSEKARILSPRDQLKEEQQQLQKLHYLQQHQATKAKQQIQILEQRRRTVQPIIHFNDASPKMPKEDTSF